MSEFKIEKNGLKMSKEKNDKARADFKQVVKDRGGCHCPLCGQFAKIYKRKLNSEMAYGLIRLYRLHSDPLAAPFFHVSEILDGYGRKTGGGDFAKLVHWGLIEQMENTDEKKRTSGMWRITTKGIVFVRQMTEMPSHVFLYDGKPEGFSMETISIKDALQERFDYAELMNY